MRLVPLMSQFLIGTPAVQWHQSSNQVPWCHPVAPGREGTNLRAWLIPTEYLTFAAEPVLAQVQAGIAICAPFQGETNVNFKNAVVRSLKVIV